MANIIDLALADFGQDVTLLTDTKEALMSGEIKFEDIKGLSGTTVNAVIIKKNVDEVQTRNGKQVSLPSYVLVPMSVDLKEHDVIVTQKEYFFVHQVSLKNDNITGAVVGEPTYKRAELELFDYI